MNKEIKKKIDFIPLIILFVSAAYTIWGYFDQQVGLMWQHYFGFSMLLITTIIFFVNHKLGVLTLGLTIILGLIGLVQLTPGISSGWIGKSFDGEMIVFLRFQWIFILWAIIHFILSGRYYIRIANPKYWNNIKSDEPYKIE